MKTRNNQTKLYKLSNYKLKKLIGKYQQEDLTVTREEMCEAAYVLYDRLVQALGKERSKKT